MISVRKEPDGFARIRDGVKAQTAVRATRDLQKSQKNTDDSDCNDNKTNVPPLLIAERQYREKNRNCWH